MLVVYDKSTGAISQVVIHAQGGLEKIKAKHDEFGNGTLMVAPDATDGQDCYVLDGRLKQRPEIGVSGLSDRVLIADGVDEMRVTIVPHCEAEIEFGGQVIHRETIKTGTIPISVTQPGEYKITLRAGFPFLDRTFTVVAK